jgi:hypothetical protein
MLASAWPQDIGGTIGGRLCGIGPALQSLSHTWLPGLSKRSMRRTATLANTECMAALLPKRRSDLKPCDTSELAVEATAAILVARARGTEDVAIGATNPETVMVSVAAARITSPSTSPGSSWLDREIHSSRRSPVDSRQVSRAKG